MLQFFVANIDILEDNVSDVTISLKKGKSFDIMCQYRRVHSRILFSFIPL